MTAGASLHRLSFTLAGSKKTQQPQPAAQQGGQDAIVPISAFCKAKLLFTCAWRSEALEKEDLQAMLASAPPATFLLATGSRGLVRSVHSDTAAQVLSTSAQEEEAAVIAVKLPAGSKLGQP
ncbi:unnamed protein product [Polarella glacialis]|uniref:Uncharacterized protein n=1 Tax=Polarella glacialis TaxID=89957 RepID=A0A813I523_POLGL|nr:unnamed protein product [Polarella glacialis]